MKNFKQLIVWQKSVELAADIYSATKQFPEAEKFGLTNQMRRAAISIPSNIAEGHMRITNKDFRQFLAIARGSCAELETQSIIATELNYLGKEIASVLAQKIQSVAKMLSALHSKTNELVI